MPDPTFNGDIQSSTFNDYIADVAYDNFFVKTALQQHMRAIGAVDPFTGGKLMEEPFIMGSPASGFAAPGTIVRDRACPATCGPGVPAPALHFAGYV